MELANKKSFRIINFFLFLILILTIILTGCNKEKSGFTNNMRKEGNISTENRLLKKVNKDNKDELINIRTKLKEINKEIDRMNKVITSKSTNLEKKTIRDNFIKQINNMLI